LNSKDGRASGSADVFVPSPPGHGEYIRLSRFTQTLSTTVDDGSPPNSSTLGASEQPLEGDTSPTAGLVLPQGLPTRPHLGSRSARGELEPSFAGITVAEQADSVQKSTSLFRALLRTNMVALFFFEKGIAVLQRYATTVATPTLRRRRSAPVARAHGETRLVQLP
jgi:hypothetical protein